MGAIQRNVRLLVCLAVALAALVAAGCGSSKSSSSSSGTTASAQDPLKIAFLTTGGPLNDGGWNQAHKIGIDEVKKKYGDKVEITTKVNVPAGAQANQVVDQLVSAGNKMIFATSFSFLKATTAAAARYPDVKFEQLEGTSRGDNIANYYGEFPDGYYLTGMIAASTSRSGNLGFVNSIPVPSLVRAINEFTLGAREVNPRATVKVVSINSFFDPPKESQASRSLIQSGADVLQSGLSTATSAQEAQEAGIPWLGFATDQRNFAPKSTLTSVIFNWGPYYNQEVGAYLDGSWQPGNRYLSFREGVVDIGPYGASYERLTTPAERAAIEKRRQELKDGSFYAFRGPLSDNTGRVRVPAGDELPLDQSRAMDWYVQGVSASN